LAYRPWHNFIYPVDVDQQGRPTAQGVLDIINYINAHPNSRTPPAWPTVPRPYYDVNGDNYVTPSDVLEVINAINRGDAGAAEAEAPAVATTAPAMMSRWRLTGLRRSPSSCLRPARRRAPRLVHQTPGERRPRRPLSRCFPPRPGRPSPMLRTAAPTRLPESSGTWIAPCSMSCQNFFRNSCRVGVQFRLRIIRLS